jgi:hypothetical protein
MFMITPRCCWLFELLPSSFAVDKRSAASDGYNENNDDDADDSVGYVVSSWIRMHTMWMTPSSTNYILRVFESYVQGAEFLPRKREE